MQRKLLIIKTLYLLVVFSVIIGCKTGDDDSTSVQQFTGMTLQDLTNNSTTTERVAVVEATVPNPNSTSTTNYNGEVRVYLNNQYVLAYPEYIEGEGWVIQRWISLNAGSNTIYVSVYYQGAEFARSNTFTVTGSFPQVPWRFELTWNTAGNDLDLHLVKDDGWTDPNLHCFYANESIQGVTLDYDDTDGYGPENISIEPNAPSGSYKVYVKYFSAESVTESVTATVKIFKNGALIDTKTRAFTASQESDYDVMYEEGKDWYVYEVTIQ